MKKEHKHTRIRTEHDNVLAVDIILRVTYVVIKKRKKIIIFYVGGGGGAGGSLIQQNAGTKQMMHRGGCTVHSLLHASIWARDARSIIALTDGFNRHRLHYIHSDFSHLCSLSSWSRFCQFLLPRSAANTASQVQLTSTRTHATPPPPLIYFWKCCC